MVESTAPVVDLAAASKQAARRLLTIGENRLELLRVEAQEERERLMVSIMLAVGAMGCGLLAAMTLTAGIVVLLWNYTRSPWVILLVLAILYGLAAALLARRLGEMWHGFQAFSATIEQLRKDRACLEKVLG